MKQGAGNSVVEYYVMRRGQRFKSAPVHQQIALWCNGSTMDSYSISSVRIRHERLGEEKCK